MRLLIPTIGACWAISTTFLAIAFGYICLTAHIDFSGREGLCLVGIAASSLLSCSIGALVGALPGRMGSDSRRGILTALTCLLSLFAGLYGEPTMELADTIAQALPAATWLNPVDVYKRQVDSEYEASASGYFQPGMSAPEVSIVDRMVRITTISRNTTAVPAMTMRALRAKRYSRDSSRGAGAEGVSHTDGTLAEPVRMKSVLTR